MVRDPRQLDQNPIVIDPADVDAVLDDRPTPPGHPLKPALDEVSHPRPLSESDRQKTSGKPVSGRVPGNARPVPVAR
ncbi:hypothetical protein LGR54_06100 [Ancylobacter sp. Lp-2]|uniref:hypothetical protein n=1 Tax=Ancylobacter sp. Lp-2 TaxID=2881339 RepID=UPI001E42DA26|nr:hypothetical protein [Ancylobacter sp. Lp-2]MCB4768171.1 hypothetical protein [Ancylobacter sp. Lp-2]